MDVETANYRPMVYVAGPITGDPFGCVGKAMRAFEHLWSAGLLPYLPQLSVIGDMVLPQDYETWMALDFEVIRRCAGLVRLPGVSPGADREVEFARSLHLIIEHWPESSTSPNSTGFGAGLAAAIHERNGQTS